MMKRAYSKMNRTKWTKSNNCSCSNSQLLKIFLILWCLGAVIIVYTHRQPPDEFLVRMEEFELKVKNTHNEQQSVKKNKIILPDSCGTTEKTYVKYYGQALNPPLNTAYFGVEETIYNAYGCSNSAKYCIGEPQAIPCCNKIMFDIWHAFDKYLTRHNVTYSLRWGSLLFGVRNGAHMPWDNRDIDLGFAFPEVDARKAMNEFVEDYGLRIPVTDQSNHITDQSVFYKLHHEKYGYPDPTQKLCFVDMEYHGGWDEYFYEDTLTLASAGRMFVDFGIGNEGAEGLDLSMSHRKPMIPVDYDGPNGMKPPRQMYVYPDFYKHLNYNYGKGNWDWARNMIPEWISDKQLEYHGMSRVNARKNWEKFQETMIEQLGKTDPFVIELLSNVN